MATRKPVPIAAPIPRRDEFTAWCLAQTAENPHFVPPNYLCEEDVEEWREAVANLAKVKAREASLRTKVFKHYFPNPAEGTNNVQRPDGSVVKATHKISRNVDETKLATLKAYKVSDLRSLLVQLNVDCASWPDDMPIVHALSLHMDKLVEYSPSLKSAEYRTLTAEQSAIFEMCLEIKDGAPQLEFIPPKATS